MENDLVNVTTSENLGDDNAQLLAEKRRRTAAGVDAGQLRQRIRQPDAAQSPARRPAQPAAGARSPSSRTSPPAASSVPPRRPTAPRPASANPAATRPAAAAASQDANVVRPAAPVHPAEARVRIAQPAVIPYQRAALTGTNTRRDTGAAATRVTDLRGVRAPREDAAPTRLNAVQQAPRKKSEPEEVKDESEGGNTLISILKAITYIVAVLVVSVFLSLFIILVGNDVYAFVKDSAQIEVTVPEYATLNEVSELLAENKIIRYPSIFKFYANFKHDDGVFLAGTYTLTPMMNYDELLAAFKPKLPSGTSRITIPEGYTTDEIIDLMVSRGIGTRERYVEVINTYDFDYWFLDELEENGVPEGRFYRLDGYLFPDTYEFYNASTEEVVINKLLKRFNQVFIDSYAQKAKELGYTVDQMLILASMIEKEAASQAEFFDISSVFNNRLRNRAAFPYLESDATIVYAIQHDTGTRINPKGEDLSYDSPYNTYTHAGFPPGPIANPSASAIRAALYPAETNYYYFVAATSSRSYFAATKEEHEKNIERIRQGDLTAETSAEPT